MSQKADEKDHRKTPADKAPDDQQPSDYLANELGALASMLGVGQRQDGAPLEDKPDQQEGPAPAPPPSDDPAAAS